MVGLWRDLRGCLVFRRLFIIFKKLVGRIIIVIKNDDWLNRFLKFAQRFDSIVFEVLSNVGLCAVIFFTFVMIGGFFYNRLSFGMETVEMLLDYFSYTELAGMLFLFMLQFILKISILTWGLLINSNELNFKTLNFLFLFGICYFALEFPNFTFEKHLLYSLPNLMFLGSWKLLILGFDLFDNNGMSFKQKWVEWCRL